MCTGCRHVRKRVSERDLDPHGCDLQVWLLDSAWERETQVRELHMCPRGDCTKSQCVLATEFALRESRCWASAPAGSVRLVRD
jgi:hypothetical protein